MPYYVDTGSEEVKNINDANDSSALPQILKCYDATVQSDEIQLPVLQTEIKVLDETNEFVVIHKPCNLRSVPGHANKFEGSTIHNKNDSMMKRKRDVDNGMPVRNRLTASEAWILALQSVIGEDYELLLPSSCAFNKEYFKSYLSPEELRFIPIYLSGLASSSHSSVPRKLKHFVTYIQRNEKRMIGNVWSQVQETVKDTTKIASVIHDFLRQRMEGFMNKPEVTRPEDSALGQVELHCFGGAGHNPRIDKIKVIHRLDCETSGVMVFAKTPIAASFLCNAWRKKSQQSKDNYFDNSKNGDTKNGEVMKGYLAVVREWPPFQKECQSTGTIDVPLKPSETERLKWEVAEPCDPQAKHCRTDWKVVDANLTLPNWCETVYGNAHNWKDCADDNGERNHKIQLTGIVLELRPITGRTHQLRVHCAHVGSGIVGDSLYGKDRIFDRAIYDPNDRQTNNANSNGPHLMLHATKLSFPYPPAEATRKNENPTLCVYSVWPSWYKPIG